MSKETDKKLSDLYLARSEGKIIQAKDALGKWHNLDPGYAINEFHRIRPQTEEEAAIESADKNWGYNNQDCRNAHITGFIKAIKWRDENPKDKE